MRIRLAIRVLIHGVTQCEERIEVESDALDSLLPDLAAQHANMMATQTGMVEIEFLDELNVNERFFRIGTDPSAMVDPVKVDLSNPTADLSKWGKRKPN